MQAHGADGAWYLYSFARKVTPGSCDYYWPPVGVVDGVNVMIGGLVGGGVRVGVAVGGSSVGQMLSVGSGVYVGRGVLVGSGELTSALGQKKGEG